MKTCTKCRCSINEKDINEKWCMLITKKGEKIIEFACFHLNCWKNFFEESVKIKLNEIKWKKSYYQ